MREYQRLLDVSRTSKPITAYRMVQLATRLYKQWYGVYPERIGLDWFSRMGEYADLYGDTYVATELIGETPGTWAPDLMLTYERIAIKVVPAIFERLEKHPRTGLVQKPAKGRDEVLCERDGQTVFMTVWFSENGYDAIAWDDWKEEQL